MLGLVTKGFLIGILVSAPMGPTGLLCVQRTLNKGRWYGFVSGLGATLSDIFYATITGLSIGLIVDFLEAYQKPIEIFGCMVLGIFGYFIFRSKPVKRLEQPGEAKQSYIRAFLTSFLLTFSNVMIVLLFLGLFARFAFSLPAKSFWIIVNGLGGIALGAVAWWFSVTYVVSKMRRWFNTKGIRVLNRTVGVIILFLALAGLVFSCLS
ncbi:MAG: LysE family translocator [Tannerella sp.]|jgi:threonine/homoserine/homoserine lactone efflux protein|nr:LysE family translocator [Tannerella sp.]